MSAGVASYSSLQVNSFGQMENKKFGALDIGNLRLSAAVSIHLMFLLQAYVRFSFDNVAFLSQ